MSPIATVTLLSLAGVVTAAIYGYGRIYRKRTGAKPSIRALIRAIRDDYATYRQRRYERVVSQVARQTEMDRGTVAGTITEIRGPFRIVDDLLSSWRFYRGSYPVPPTPEPVKTPTSTPESEETAPVPVELEQPQTSTSERKTMFGQLFETGDTLAAAPFEHINQVEGFIAALADQLPGVQQMYAALAARMRERINIDRLVWEPVDQCASFQAHVVEAVNDARSSLDLILRSTTEELLDKGVKVPPPELFEGEATASSGAALIPGFFEKAKTLAEQSFSDLRDLHALLKALRVASDSQIAMYTNVAVRLDDAGIDVSVSDQFHLASRHQTTISVLLAEADTWMTKLMRMTIRELAAAGVRVPHGDLRDR